MHAAHGNGGPPWQPAGRPPGEARLLQDLHPVGKLRAAGWRVLADVPDTYMLRVYDTRIETRWLAGLAQELIGNSAPATYVIGGDFLSQPALEDGAALHPTDLRRWGPAGEDAYCLLVPPRPHVAVWAQRCVSQMRVEAAGAVCLLCAVVPRDQVTAGVDMESLRQMLPQASSLFLAKDLRVEVKIVGERAPVYRVPATKDEKVLPPPSWESAWLPVNRVLVVLVIRRAQSAWQVPVVTAIRGDLPSRKADGLELLRLEFQLPPATRQVNAEKAARAALRKLAGAMQLPEPPGPQPLRQLVVQHGGVLAILAVPRGQAVEWLRGSGCGGLYLRPFWTSQTDDSVSRQRFSLLWLRGKADRGPGLWEAFRHKPGVVGLVLAGRDVAVRVDHTADVGQLQAQLGLSLGNPEEKFRQAAAGQRWWRLGPLTEAECWRAADMIRSLGLEPLRGELRFARMGQWRHSVFFAAVGHPSKMSFDDGSRGCSEAALAEANPPPRSTVKSAAPSKAVVGTALPPSSTWAGPRSEVHSPPQSAPGLQQADQRPAQRMAPLAVPGRDPQQAAPQQEACPAVTPPCSAPPAPSRRRAHRRSRRTPEAPAPVPTPFGYYSEDQPLSVSGRLQRRQRGGRSGPHQDEMEELHGLIQELRAELRALRRENELLRRAQVLTPWQSVPAPPHQQAPTPSTPPALRPLPAPHFSPVQPLMLMELDAAGAGPRQREHGDTPDAKRTPGAARALVVDGPDVE